MFLVQIVHGPKIFSTTFRSSSESKRFPLRPPIEFATDHLQQTGHSVLLIRHCQATGQEPDAPLTETGHQQAQTFADFLSDYPIDHITTSEYLRARQSIEPFASTSDLPVHTDPRFNERTLSAGPIQNWQDVVRDSFDDLDLCAPGGESAREVLARAWTALNEIIAASHSLPLVVTHGNLMALVLHSLNRTFGFEGWKLLSNPDVFMLDDARSRQMTFERIWRSS